MTFDESKERRRERIERERERLYRRLILRLIGIAAAVLLVIVAIIVACVFEAKKETPEYDKVIVIVHAGDTPWGIARRYCPNYVDIRDYLLQIEEINGIDFGDPIYPGQRIIFFEEVDG